MRRRCAVTGYRLSVVNNKDTFFDNNQSGESHPGRRGRRGQTGRSTRARARWGLAHFLLRSPSPLSPLLISENWSLISWRHWLNKSKTTISFIISLNYKLWKIVNINNRRCNHLLLFFRKIKCKLSILFWIFDCLFKNLIVILFYKVL